MISNTSTILGVRIDNIKRNEALEKVSEFLNSTGQHKIFTPNPEMLVEAHKDQAFREILNSSSLNICDGKGIQLVAKEKIERIPGVDFMLDICKLASEQRRRVYLLGAGKTGGPDKTAKALKKKFPQLNIVGLNAGPRLEHLNTYKPVSQEENERILQNINSTNPDILFVGFGHCKQEYWIDKNLKNLPSIKIAIGVGGAFDFIAGNVKRAPKWMRNTGFEWLFRLIQEPKRVGRIWNATVVFLYLNYTKKR